MKIAERLVAVSALVAEQRTALNDATAALTDLQDRRDSALTAGDVDHARALAQQLAEARAAVAALGPEVEELESVERGLRAEADRAERTERIGAAQDQLDLELGRIFERLAAAVDHIQQAQNLLAEAEAIERLPVFALTEEIGTLARALNPDTGRVTQPRPVQALLDEGPILAEVMHFSRQRLAALTQYVERQAAWRRPRVQVSA